MRRCRPLLGTFVEIASDHAGAIEQGFAAIERVHRLMSAHDPMSELGRLNRGETVAPSLDTRAVIERALFWYEASSGIFDPAAAGRRALIEGRLPLHQGQTAPDRSSDLGSLKLDDGHAWLSHPACIDLGGIAKGHAVDRALAAMRAFGAAWALVNAGGDLAAFGRPQSVAIVDPLTRVPRVTVRVHERAVATSAALIVNGQPDWQHLPLRGGNWISVTVEAALAIDADALTKIAWVNHPRLQELLPLAGARALAIGAGGAVQELGLKAVA